MRLEAADAIAAQGLPVTEGNVVALPRRGGGDGDGPHLAASCKCLACGHEWVAVAPIGTTAFTCPKCDTQRGVSVSHVTPGEGVPIWHCGCGCWAFAIRQGGEAICLACGVAQRW